MSSIAFHTQTKTLRVSGRDRALMNHRVNQLFLAAADLTLCRYYRDEQHPWQPFIHGFESNGKKGAEWAESFRLMATVDGERCSLVIGDERINFWCLALNTALACGDVMRLMARLHGQCEIHCWVDGPNRDWIAKIIRLGMEKGMLSVDAYGYDGWEAVAKMLERSNNSPVVTSYSVCESFPNPGVAGWKPTKLVDGEADWDEFYRLPAYKQWELGMTVLRKDEGKLELRPDWDDYYFGESNLNAYQALRLAYKTQPKK